MMAVRARQRRAALRRRLAAAETLAKVGTFYTWRTREGRGIECSPQLLRIFGFAAESPPTQLERVLDRVHPDDRDIVESAVEQSLRTGAAFDLRHRVVRPDGTQRAVRAHGAAVRHGRRRYDVHGAVQDVTETEQAVSQLMAAESRYGAIVEHANDGVWILDRSGRTSFVNRRLSEMLGYPPREILGRPPSDFAESETPQLREERRSHYECRYARRDGQDLWTTNALSRLPDAHGGGSLLLVTDITARKLMEGRLHQAAERDPLTGLLNRSRFELLLDRRLEDAGRAAEPLALLFLDLDHFKFVNDSFGHSVGDALVREVAACLLKLLRQQDIVARFGADEFLIALPGAGREVGIAVAQRLLDVIRERRWQSLSRITASAGLAIAEPGRPTTRAELLIAADNGLHEAKSSGRDRVAIGSSESKGAFHWVDEIRTALDENRLVLHAQPIVPLAAPGRRRHELLLRMVTRDGELVQPGAFIPAAEQFGLMHELDRWVVDGAIELARRGMEVEINLSGASLGDPEIRRRVEAEVADGLPPELLTFEVTETTAARNIDAARDFAEELERLGCRFALDDFGTGFGSLIYLKHLPFSQLKIDIEFVRELTSSESSQRLVGAIVQMAAPLGLETVAEGVEDGETLALLRELGVDYAQGYFIARPAPVTAIEPRSGRFRDELPTKTP